MGSSPEASKAEDENRAKAIKFSERPGHVRDHVEDFFYADEAPTLNAEASGPSFAGFALLGFVLWGFAFCQSLLLCLAMRNVSHPNSAERKRTDRQIKPSLQLERSNLGIYLPS
jgi:hypothetical protein